LTGQYTNRKIIDIDLCQGQKTVLQILVVTFDTAHYSNRNTDYTTTTTNMEVGYGTSGKPGNACPSR